MQVRRPSFDVLMRRVRVSLTTWPSPREWLLVAVVAMAALLLEGMVGLWGGFLRPTSPDGSVLPASLLLAVFVPAIGEELVFRGLLVPGREEASTAGLAIVLSTALFVLWHVFEALTFMPGAAHIFLRPDFLLTTAILGVTCAVLRHRTGSLWPAVLLHWLEVAAWQIWFGGGMLLKG